jgi:hypothetical protein
MKNSPNDKDWSESRIIISVSAFLSVIGGFSPVSTPHWMYDKIGVNFEDHRRVSERFFFVKITASETLERVAGFLLVKSVGNSYQLKSLKSNITTVSYLKMLKTTSTQIQKVLIQKISISGPLSF